MRERKIYKKPAVTKVNLKTDEAVLTFCRKPGWAGAIFSCDSVGASENCSICKLWGS